jgi:CDP-6-deoxy-D-xylo-4-hexulose-3-dehydrase
MWRLAEDTLDDRDMAALSEWVATSPHLTQGPLVREFEAAWARWIGSEHAVMMSSGSTANFALVLAAARRVGRTPRVGVSSVTWSTNVSPSMLMGHDIHVFDVDRRTLGVDEAQVLSAIADNKIDILFVTHLLGFNALTDAIVVAADAAGVIIIEDVCESHGARHGAKRAGTVGLGGTFSFYFGHHMSTIEGGMVVTDDAQLADELRLIRAHGLARETSKFEEHKLAHPDVDHRFLFLTAGLNFRSSDLNAFLGLRQLTTLDERVAVRNRNLEAFLATAPDKLWTDFRTAGVSSFAFPLIAKTDAAFESVVEAVDALGIERRPVVAGNLLVQPFFRTYEQVTAEPTPNADEVHRRGIYVGNGHHVAEQQVIELTDRLRKVLG